MPDAILFDLDGTLIDSAGDIATAANRALADLGRPERTDPEVRGFIGDGLRLLMERCLGAPQEPAMVDQAVQRFHVHYEACALDTTFLFPGVAQLLDALTGSLAVVSNKPEGFCRRILEGLDVAKRFTLVAGGDTFEERKPSPIPFIRACADLGAPPGQSTVVGDGRQDMIAGKAAGCRTLGVLWGQSSEEQLRMAGADAVLETVDALLGTLSGP